jgi:hypothetical protein
MAWLSAPEGARGEQLLGGGTVDPSGTLLERRAVSLSCAPSSLSEAFAEHG